MCETKITNDIRNYMQNDACMYDIEYDLVKENHIPWFGHHNKDKIEKLLDDIDAEHKSVQDKYVKIQEDQERILDVIFQLKVDNADLRELLSMYVAFGKAMAKDYIVQNAYPDGIGVELNETKMRERARQLGIESQHV